MRDAETHLFHALQVQCIKWQSDGTTFHLIYYTYMYCILGPLILMYKVRGGPVEIDEVLIAYHAQLIKCLCHYCHHANCCS